MWRLPPPPLPPARSPTCQRRLGCGDASDRAVAAPPTLASARIFRPIVSRSFLLLRPRSRAWPLLSPIVPRKQNGGGGAPVRAHPFSPSVAPSARAWAQLSGGAHSPWLPPFPGPLTFPEAELLSVAWSPRTRARVGTHTPSHPEEPRRAQNGRSPSPACPLCSATSLPSRSGLVSSQFPRREIALLCPEHGPGNSFPRRSLREAFMGSSGSENLDL